MIASTTQERLNAKHLPASHQPPPPCIALLGGPGTGKTYALRHAFALQQHFAPHSFRCCAPTNAAARLIGGATLHSACNLPIGEWTARDRAMALTKENLLHMWRNIELFAIDEISMVSAEMLSKVEFRSQQLLQRPQVPWGGLATIFSGDPDQLPPVAATSIFATEAAPPKANAGSAAQQSYQDACRGLQLWQQLSHCVVLQYTHRTQGSLNDILAAMRAGHMPDTLWRALLARVLQPNDLRSAEPQFWGRDSCVGVLRPLATVYRAQALASASGQRLILVLPADRCWTSEISLHDPALLQYLTRIDNLTTTKNLAGCLFLWHGAMLVLEHKLDETLGLVRGCTATVRRILLHPSEPYFLFGPEPGAPYLMLCSVWTDSTHNRGKLSA